MSTRAPLAAAAHKFGRFVLPVIVMWLMSGFVRIQAPPDAGSKAFQDVALLVLWVASGAFRDAFAPMGPPVGAPPNELQDIVGLARLNRIDVAVGVLQSRSGLSWVGLVGRDSVYFTSPYVGSLSRQEREEYLGAGAVVMPLIPRRLPPWRSIPKGLRAMPELVFALLFPSVMATLRHVVAGVPPAACAALWLHLFFGMTLVFAISRYWYYARVATALASKDARSDVS